MEGRDSLYMTDDANETTFKYDEQLPPLPVPRLEQTIEKLLDTIRPTGTPEKWAITKRKAEEFLRDPNVHQLQQMLEERAKSHKNWLESWWLEFAYLRSRKPLIPYSNMAAPLPVMECWPIMDRQQAGFDTCRVERSALSIYFQMCFWQMLRQEKMRPMIHKGVPWSMSQFRYLFNTCRLPSDPMDELRSHFRLASEGPPISTEIIVLHRGYIFAISTTQAVSSPSQEPKLLGPQALASQLRYIEDWAKYRPHGPGVGALTTGERSDWAEAYQYMGELSAKNRRLLDRIERALSVFILDDHEPVTSEQMLRLSMCGDPLNRWADKSVSSIAFKNGTFGASADHTPYDGFCTAIKTHYLMASIKECQGKWTNLEEPNQQPHQAQPELLDFDLDDKLNNCINEAKSSFEDLTNTIDTLHATFGHYGKALLKEHRFHPEAFVQCAIHLAYYRQHGQAAPAYVTASTRRFYRGRTETCRSCYPEMYQFAQSVLSDKLDALKSYELLKQSVGKFQKLMSEASNGQGCDRHLLGLYLLAMLEGRDIPELFDDELVRQTNNYILSTSCSGYWNVCGGVPPLVEDGYGCFYGIEDDRITFCCTAYKTCPEVDVRKFYANICKSLGEMQKILIANKL